MLCFFMYMCSTRAVAITLTVFSVIFALFSAGTIYLNSRLVDSDLWNLQTHPEDDINNQKRSDEINYIKEVVFWGIIAMCIASILTGFLGSATARYKTCCSIGVYSFFTFSLSLMFLGLGIIIIIVTIASGQQLTQYCYDKNYDQFTINLSRQTQKFQEFFIEFYNVIIFYFLNYVEEYDRATSKLPNTYMCSYYCPCVPLDPNKWNGIDIKQGSSTQLYFTGTYSTFNQCYLDLVRDQRVTPIHSKVLSLIKTLESDHSCSGLCGSHKFWFYKSINDGPPKDNCQDGIHLMYWGSLGAVSIALIITGFVIFLAFNAHYGLWRRRFTRGGSNINNSRSNAYKLED